MKHRSSPIHNVSVLDPQSGGNDLEMGCCETDAATHAGANGSGRYVAIPKSIKRPEVCFGAVRTPRIMCITSLRSNLNLFS